MRIERARMAIVAIGGAGLALGYAGDATACMCLRTKYFAVVGPNMVDDAPRNARVRIEMANGALEAAGANARIVLRASGGGGGAIVPTIDRGPLPAKGLSTLVELRPRALLAASTRYEVALLLPPESHPNVHVLATFKTGTTSDVTPPELDPLGNVKVGGLPPPPAPPGQQVVTVVSSCGGNTPHVMIDKVTSRDPKRPNAQLVYGVWIGDRTGKVDATQPPTGMFLPQPDNTLTIGARDLCTMDFPFPDEPFVWLGIAAVDEAGNPSKVRTIRVALR